MPAIASKPHLHLLIQVGIAAVCFVVAAMAIILFLRNIPFDIDGAAFGVDWQHIWSSLQNGHIHYDDWLRIVPWTVLLVLPLGFLSLRDSWAILTLFTLCVLIVSVPRVQEKKWRFWLGMFMLVTAFPNLRELVDGNFEGLVIAGVLIFLYGFVRQDALITAIGALIMVTKPQDTWLLCIAAGWLMLKAWPRTKLIQFGLVVLVVALPTLVWLGPAWIASIAPLTARDSTNISLKALTGQLALSPFWLVVAWLLVFGVTAYVVGRGNSGLSRMKAGLLMCTSLLLTPYAESNAFVTILAIAIIPLLFIRPLPGGLLILLVDIPFLIAPQSMLHYGSYYWIVVILLTWGILTWQVYATECRPKRAVPAPVIEPSAAVSA